jgi:hypothetical protein
MPDITSDPHRRRPVLGWIALATGLALAVWRGVYALQAYRLWQELRVSDPSGAELYELTSRVEASMALIGVAISTIGLWLIRRVSRRRSADPR